MRSHLIWLSTLLLLVPTARAEADAQALWNSGVRELLDQNCVKCHGPIEQKSELELDTVEAALKGSDLGPVIVPGKPEESLLIAALEAGADPHMPPKKQLSHGQIEQLRAWVTALGQANASAPPAIVSTEPVPQDPVAAIDHFIAHGWKAREVSPADVCDDQTFVRRVYLDLAGRIPKPQEVESFLSEPSPQKRAALTDQLLNSDEYAVAFREVWDVLLMGRNAGRREQRRRDSGWHAFLERAFNENRPWNEVVRDVLIARPEKKEDKGASWFLYERRNDHQRIAEAVAPLVYGTRIDCAQCHDHPLAREIKQGHYWGLVTAFNRSKNVEKGPAVVGESAIGGFVNFTNLKKESQAAVMMTLNAGTLDEPRPAPETKQEDLPDAYVDPAAPVKVPKFSRRAAFAEAVTRDNPLLARSFVNHTWAILIGRGIVHPVDEMNTRNTPSHPEMLEWLAKDFVANNYDTRRLVRSIVLSRAYQLSTWRGEGAPAPEAFAAAAERPLTAETLARSMYIASGRPVSDALRPAFADAFPDVLPRVTRATIQQAMLLANNEGVSGLFKPEAGTIAERIAALGTVEDRVKEAFRAALVRQPDAEELARGVEFLKSREDRAAIATGELLWALVTGPEFLTNH